MTMIKQFQTAVVLFMGLTFLTGVVYPWAVTVVAQAIFSSAANGSVIYRGGNAVGSEWIGQSFSRPEYFWGRLSATAPVPYNAVSSGGSNFGPMHPNLREGAKQRWSALTSYATPEKQVPVDLVTSSGSGLDPHISLAAAEFQVPRVATARKLEVAVVRELVRQNTDGRQLGVLGEPRVHVLRLNLALDHRQPKE